MDRLDMKLFRVPPVAQHEVRDSDAAQVEERRRIRLSSQRGTFLKPMSYRGRHELFDLQAFRGFPAANRAHFWSLILSVPRRCGETSFSVLLQTFLLLHHFTVNLLR